MRLLFVYIEDYRVHHKKSFSFDANDRFAFNDGELTYRHVRGMPKDFFCIKKSLSVKRLRKCGKVESVSALIGANGAGKTSLMSFLDDIFAEGDSSMIPRFLVVFSREVGKNENFECWDNLESTVGVESIKRMLGDRFLYVHYPIWSKIPRFPFEVIYYSPYYSQQKVISRKQAGITDISTAGLMRNVACCNSSDFDKDERTRLLKITKRFGDRLDLVDKDMPMPSPGTVTIRVFEKYALACSRAFKVRSNDKDINTELADLFKVSAEVLSIAHVKELSVRVFAGYLASTVTILHKYANVQVQRYVSELIELARSIRNDISERRGNQHDFRHKLKNLVSTIAPPEDDENDALARRHRALIRVLEALNEFVPDESNRESQEEVTFNLVDHNQGVAFYKLISGCDEITRVGERQGDADFVDISYGKSSAGEMAFLSLFGRLDEVIGDCKARGCDSPQDILLFLDEAETTLHPDWQRKLVKTVIWYVENFAASLRVHVIFASHSPMLLSDIPSSNVVFLSPRQPDAGSKKSHSLRNSFGSNIFDLYRFAFDLRDGVCGTFAQMKIEALLKKAHSYRCLSEDEKLIVDNIGDSIIRTYILESNRRNQVIPK